MNIRRTDGAPEIVRTGTEAQVMADVTYDYDEPGVYTVRLTMIGQHADLSP